MKIDFHCHIFTKTNSKENFFQQFDKFSGYGFYERIKEQLNHVQSKNIENLLHRTLYCVKKANLDKVVLLPVNMKENQQVIEWSKAAPDVFIPFFNPPERLNPNLNVKKVLETQLRENNIRGFKIMISFRSRSLNDRILYPTFEIAAKNQLPIVMHTGYPPPGTKTNVLTYADPLKIEEILPSFPKLIIIIAHMGFPWVDVALALAVQYPMIYLDISNLIYMMPNRLKEFIIHAKELIGIDKLLFGSDGFIPEMIEMTVNMFEDVSYLSKEEIEKIMGWNAERILFK
ncbi:MAG: Amidohydrolase [Promethearchaeota archaeon]|nr:MAG: Amidohydrolase [Candidatus Lokiarchaeota archaeon]